MKHLFLFTLLVISLNAVCQQKQLGEPKKDWITDDTYAVSLKGCYKLVTTIPEIGEPLLYHFKGNILRQFTTQKGGDIEYTIYFPKGYGRKIIWYLRQINNL